MFKQIFARMKGILVSYDINFTVIDLSEVSKASLVFENRRKGGMKYHFRFEYPDKKQDSIIYYVLKSL